MVERVFRAMVLGMLAVAGANVAGAGEYNTVSIGVQIDAAQASTKFVPFQSQAGNIQGAQVGTLLGFGLTSQVRFGSLISQHLSSLVVTPSVIYRYGKQDDRTVDANLNFYTSNGSIVSIQNASSNRSTSSKVLSFVLPLRWYMSGTATYGGIFVEAGFALGRYEQNVDLAVAGLIKAQPSQINESAKIIQTTTGYCAGVGYTRVYRESQATVLLQFQDLSAPKGSTIGPGSEIRVGMQWTF